MFAKHCSGWLIEPNSPGESATSITGFHGGGAFGGTGFGRENREAASQKREILQENDPCENVEAYSSS